MADLIGRRPGLVEYRGLAVGDLPFGPVLGLGKFGGNSLSEFCLLL